MGGFQKAGCVPVFGLVVFAVTSCITEPEADLAHNESLYRAPDYEAPRTTPQAVYVQRLRDRRTLPSTTKDGTSRTVLPDQGWARSVPVMVEDCIVDAIGKSHIYREVTEGVDGRPGPADFIVEPTLLHLYRALERLGAGDYLAERRIVAIATIGLKVKGPVDGSGKRPVLLDEVFTHRVETPPIVGRPKGDGLPQVGRALHIAIGNALVKLYESNIAMAEPEPGPGR